MAVEDDACKPIWSNTGRKKHDELEPPTDCPDVAAKDETIAS